MQVQLALCDGDPALQARLEDRLPDFELILDFVHAVGYLWKAAEVVFKDKADRQHWVQAQALRLLHGQVESVDLEQQARRQQHRWQRQILLQVVGYRNQARMRYARYLARGWPTPESSKGPVGIWSRIAVRALACAGPRTGPNICCSCEPSGSTAMEKRITISIGYVGINGVTGSSRSKKNSLKNRLGNGPHDPVVQLK